MAKGLILHAFGKDDDELVACLEDLLRDLKDGRAKAEGNGRVMLSCGAEYDWDAFDTNGIKDIKDINALISKYWNT
jgi:hypothetical protein